MAQALITRESDGLRFEPCFHPDMARCEACLELVEPSALREHLCLDWWNSPYDFGSLLDERLPEPTPVERGVLDRYNQPNKIIRRSRK